MKNCKDYDLILAENKALHQKISAFEAMIGFSCFTCSCASILQIKQLLAEYHAEYPEEKKDEYHISPKQLKLF